MYSIERSGPDPAVSNQYEEEIVVDGNGFEWRWEFRLKHIILGKPKNR